MTDRKTTPLLGLLNGCALPVLACAAFAAPASAQDTPAAPQMETSQIQDIVVANTATLKAHPEFGKALAGAWYEMHM